MTAPKCPSCNATLEKMPARKTKCKACGQFIYIKSTPSNRKKRLMTEVQAERAEAEWHERYVLSRLDDDNRSLGLPIGQGAAVSRASMTQLALEQPADSHRRKMAAHLLSSPRHSPDLESRVRWAMLAATIELEGLRHVGDCAEILAGRDPCPSCASLRGRIWMIDVALRSMPIPNVGCEKFLRGGGCCACWVSVK